RARGGVASERALDRPDRRGDRGRGRGARACGSRLPTLRRSCHRRRRGGGRCRTGGRRPPLAPVRELRPVSRLRGARRDLPAPGRGSLVKKGQLEQHLLALVTLALVAFGLVMVYSATSAPAALARTDPMSYLKKQGIYALIG